MPSTAELAEGASKKREPALTANKSGGRFVAGRRFAGKGEGVTAAVAAFDSSLVESARCNDSKDFFVLVTIDRLHAARQLKDNLRPTGIDKEAVYQKHKWRNKRRRGLDLPGRGTFCRLLWGSAATKWAHCAE